MLLTSPVISVTSSSNRLSADISLDIPISANSHSSDPSSSSSAYGGSHFWVEIEGMLEAVFTECSGLQAQTEIQEYKEGGINAFSHKLAGRTSFSNMVLKRGVTLSPKFWEWYSQTISGKIKRTNLSVILYSNSGDPVRRWEVFSAFPIKWSGPDLRSTGNDMAVETLELAYQRFTVK